MNKIIVSGNLVKDIEVINNAVKNVVAVKRDYKTNDKYETDFFDIIAFGNNATYLSKYAKKGDRVELCGKMQIRNYQAADGTTRKFYEILVESINSFGSKNTEQTESVDQDADAEGLPF